MKDVGAGAPRAEQRGREQSVERLITEFCIERRSQSRDRCDLTFTLKSVSIRFVSRFLPHAPAETALRADCIAVPLTRTECPTTSLWQVKIALFEFQFRHFPFAAASLPLWIVNSARKQWIEIVKSSKINVYCSKFTRASDSHVMKSAAWQAARPSTRKCTEKEQHKNDSEMFGFRLVFAFRCEREGARGSEQRRCLPRHSSAALRRGKQPMGFQTACVPCARTFDVQIRFDIVAAAPMAAS